MVFEFEGEAVADPTDPGEVVSAKASPGKRQPDIGLGGITGTGAAAFGIARAEGDGEIGAVGNGPARGSNHPLKQIEALFVTSAHDGPLIASSA